MALDIDEIDLDLDSPVPPPTSITEPLANVDVQAKEELVPDPPAEEPKGEVVDDQDGEEEEGFYDDDEADDSNSLIKSLVAQSGFEFDDDEFPDTPEGYFALSREIANKHFDSQLENLRQNNPVAGEFLDHLIAGGDPSAFQEVYSEVDYSSIELNDDESLLADVVRHRLIVDGYTEDQIENTVERYRNGGMLREEAEISLGRLQKAQEDERYQLAVRREEDNRQKELRVQEYVSSVSTKIKNSNDIKGVPLTEKDKGGFTDFITKVDPRTGRTGYDAAIQEMSEEDVLLVQYLTYKKLDIGTFVKNQARSSRVKSLTEMADGSKSLRGSRQDRPRVTGVNVDDLVL